MKYFLLSLLFVSSALAQQVNNRLDVKDLRLPSEAKSKALYIDANGQIKASAIISSSDLATLNGISTDKTIQAQIDEAKSLASDLSEEVVLKTTDQSIDGSKTFIGKLKVSGTQNGSVPCPSMTEVQRDEIENPENGECITNTDRNTLNIYSSSANKWSSAGGGLSPWSTLATYSVGDIVISDNKIYKALEDHASLNFNDDLISGKWIRLNDELNVNNLNASKLKVPRNQASLTSNNEIYIETGNKNLLKNPSFEVGGTNPTDWICTNVTSWNRLEQPSPDGEFYVNAICPADTTCECSQTVTGLLNMEAFASAYFRSASSDTSKRTFFVSSLAPDPYTQEVPIKSGAEFEKYTLQLGAKTGTSVKIGVRIENGIDSGAVRMDDFRLEYGSVFTGIKNTTNFKSYGPIQIRATTTAPTKNATPQFDDVSCGKDGEFVDCDYSFYQNANGVAGSGDYIFSIPSEFENASTTYFTGAFPSTGGAHIGEPAVQAQMDSFGVVSSVSGTNTGYATAIAYDSKSFRIRADQLFATNKPVGSSFYSLGSATSIKIRIRFKGKGLRSTVDIASQAMNYKELKNHASFSFHVNHPYSTVNQELPFVGSCSAASGVIGCTLNGLTSKPRCTATVASDGSAASRSVEIIENTSTSTLLNIRLWVNSTLSTDVPVNVTCHKTGQDAIEAYRSIALMTIRESNIYYDRDEFHTDERDTGRKWGGKAIFKKCAGGIAVNIANGSSITTGAESIFRISGWVSGSANDRIHFGYAGSSNSGVVLSNKTTGNVNFINGYQANAPAMICVEYTKL